MEVEAYIITSAMSCYQWELGTGDWFIQRQNQIILKHLLNLIGIHISKFKLLKEY